MAKEFFLVEGDGRIVLFAPQRGLLMEISEEEKEAVSALINRPQFAFRELLEMFPEIEEDRLVSQCGEERGVTANDEEFRPDAAILFPTLGCHLRCVYCYSEGGKQKVSMNRDVAKATVEFVVENAKSKDRDGCFLEFHGGGEPTWNWAVFQFTLRYFQEKTRENGLIPEVNLATNGMLSKQQVDWIAESMEEVQVSLDGMAEIQNFQRPTAGKGESFSVVSRTVAAFLEKGVRVIIHSVITERGMARIPEIVHFFAVNFPGATVKIEPGFPCGRGLVTGQRFPSTELFVNGFIEAEKLAASLGVKVCYSGLNPLSECRDTFCGVSEPNFVVTPSGLVTACNEVAGPEHPLAGCFIYGYFNRQSGRFVFDQEKIKRLRHYAAERSSVCAECFARFSCAGECLVKNVDSNGVLNPPLMNPRCTINRELTRHYILDQLSMRKEVSA